MGDENKTGEEIKDQNSNAEGGDNQDESQNDAGAEDEGNSDDENAEDKNDGDEADEDEGDDKKSDKSKSKPTPKADEPQTRKRNIDFIRDRQARKAEKQKAKQDNGAENDGDEEDDLAPEDAKVIDRRVKKILSPFIQKQMADEDAQEIADFVAKNPDFKPYVEKVARFAQHESRRYMPIESIFYEVAGKDLLKIGAERGKKADKEAKQTQAGGGSNRGGDTPKNVWDLTPEEFAAEQEKIRNKPRE